MDRASPAWSLHSPWALIPVALMLVSQWGDSPALSPARASPCTQLERRLRKAQNDIQLRSGVLTFCPSTRSLAFQWEFTNKWGTSSLTHGSAPHTTLWQHMERRILVQPVSSSTSPLHQRHLLGPLAPPPRIFHLSAETLPLPSLPLPFFLRVQVRR